MQDFDSVKQSIIEQLQQTAQADLNEDALVDELQSHYDAAYAQSFKSGVQRALTQINERRAQLSQSYETIEVEHIDISDMLPPIHELKGSQPEQPALEQAQPDVEYPTDSMTVEQLKTWLNTHGIGFESKARKAVLLEQAQSHYMTLINS